ncbi:MAG: hypothetical protein AABM66_11905 [Actinomycetota bacterium]
MSDSIAAKNRWLREIRRRSDANGRITPEAEQEAREAVGLERLPESASEEVPADLDVQIREAEHAGDVTRSIALKNQKLRALDN